MKAHIVSLLCLSVLCMAHTTHAESLNLHWDLPLELSDQNTRIRFEVDSTWHLVKGNAAGVSGTVLLQDTAGPPAFRVTLTLPVSKLDTGNSMRDERLQEIMSAADYPAIIFQSSYLSDSCSPQKVIRDGPCSDLIFGDLSILAVKKRVAIPITILREHTGWLVSGKIPLRWAEFGVEDPSILVARVDPVVTVFFTVILQTQPATDEQKE